VILLKPLPPKGIYVLKLDEIICLVASSIRNASLEDMQGDPFSTTIKILLSIKSICFWFNFIIIRIEIYFYFSIFINKNIVYKTR